MKNLIVKATVLCIPFILFSFVNFKILHDVFFNQIVFILKILKLDFETKGYYIIENKFISMITYECIGLKQLYLFFVLIFLPENINLNYRLKGLLFIFPLYIYNIFRVFNGLHIIPIF